MRWRTESVVLSGEDGALHGQLLVPVGEGPFPAAVLCHGMGADHRAMRPVAQKLVRKGVATLAFDFRGHGKSAGVVDDGVVQDVVGALSFLRNQAMVNPRRVALVGHSFGAWVAILAALKCKDIGALVSISSPGGVKDEQDEEHASLRRKLTQPGRIFEYPRGGPLPGSQGFAGFLVTLWMWIRGYRARVNWQKTLRVGEKVRSVALEQMGDFPKLLVHCSGDSVTPYASALELYERLDSPKEFLVAPGFHSTPLLPGKLRDRWVDWLVAALSGPADDVEDAVDARED